MQWLLFDNDAIDAGAADDNDINDIPIPIYIILFRTDCFEKILKFEKRNRIVFKIS